MEGIKAKVSFVGDDGKWIYKWSGCMYGWIDDYGSDVDGVMGKTYGENCGQR